MPPGACSLSLWSFPAAHRIPPGGGLTKRLHIVMESARAWGLSLLVRRWMWTPADATRRLAGWPPTPSSCDSHGNGGLTGPAVFTALSVSTLAAGTSNVGNPAAFSRHGERPSSLSGPVLALGPERVELAVQGVQDRAEGIASLIPGVNKLQRVCFVYRALVRTHILLWL